MKKALVALLFCLVPGSASFTQSSDVKVVATAIPLDPADPGRRSLGRLRYLGGWHLTSRQQNFGGYSSLYVEEDRFVALSDGGDLLRFRIDAAGNVSDSHFNELPAFPAYTGNRSDRDAESMTFGPGGDIWVGFEGHNAILRYAKDFTQLHSLAWPPAMRDWSANSGPEAIVRLTGGRFVVFAEGKLVARGTRAALMFPGDPTMLRNKPFAFGYRPPKGYVATDAAELPDGRIMVLNRRFGVFEGFSMALAIVDTKAIKPGANVPGQLVAELKPPLNIDNMEGLSITREGGRTILWMISDDNQVPIERTLLLKFEFLG